MSPEDNHKHYKKKRETNMENWREVLNKMWDMDNREILIASHRGKFSSSVMENTTLAFLLAIGEGAHMVEMDLAKTKDGRIVAHHDNDMTRLFHTAETIEEKTLEELEAMPLYNYLGEICVERLETFDEILDGLKDKTVLVLDKCWDCWDEVYELLVKKDMVEQTIFKFYLRDEKPLLWAREHKDCMFIPMWKEIELLDRLADLKTAAKVPAVEITPKKVTDDVFRPETFKWLKDRHMKVWCNSLSLAKRLVYGAGFDDLKSLYHGGDAGWGELIKQGVDIIQTDWPYELKCYLETRKL